jgi:putative FmdB family regulatory protein
MPTYEYECDACGHSFEILQSMLEKKLKKCPECNKNRLHRLIGAGTGIIFKGSGFYETDYKKKRPFESASGDKAKGSPAKTTGSEAGKGVSSEKSAGKEEAGQAT